MPGVEMSLTTITSRRLRSSFPRPYCDRALAVLGGEADQHLLGAPAGGQGAEHVRRSARARALGAPLVLLELAAPPARPAGSRRPRRPSAARRSRRNSARRRRRARAAVPTRDHLGAGRRLERSTLAATTRHLGTAARRFGREREAHPPRGAVADVADAVDRLAGAAGGDQHAQAAPGAARAQQRLDRGQQLGGLGQAADPVLAVGAELALARAAITVTPRARQQLEVGLRGRVLGTSGCSSPARPRPGSRRASAAAVSRLSAWPWASLAIVFALAGAIRYSVRALDQRQVADRRALGQRLAGVGAARRVGLELARSAPARR